MQKLLRCLAATKYQIVLELILWNFSQIMKQISSDILFARKSFELNLFLIASTTFKLAQGTISQIAFCRVDWVDNDNQFNKG